MFFRGRTPEPSVWRRFRSGLDGFTFMQDGDVYVAHIAANAERTVDLFHALTEQLPPAVDVFLEDIRSGMRWRGETIALPDVRESIARLKVVLATYGGVEFAVYSTEDQVTLNEHLELFIYSRTDQWLYLLQGKGLEEHRAIRTRSWKLNRQELQPAPELVDAVRQAAERMGLRAV